MMRILLSLTLSGSALALLLLALRYLILKKMPSTVYYYAWLFVLLRFILPLPGLVPTELRERMKCKVRSIVERLPPIRRRSPKQRPPLLCQRRVPSRVMSRRLSSLSHTNPRQSSPRRGQKQSVM